MVPEHDHDHERETVLEARDVVVVKGDQRILDGASLAVPATSETVVRGESGSGKTTLFYVLGLLDVPTAGSVVVAGTDAATLSERRRARLRREHIGFVFQDFQLVPDLTAWGNARLPQEHAETPDEAWLARVFDRLGIDHLRERTPPVLSGGEKQRVAIARALANRPRVVLADEPTGQLDPDTEREVIALLRDVNRQFDTALVVISHSRALAEGFGRQRLLRDGRLVDPGSSRVGE